MKTIKLIAYAIASFIGILLGWLIAGPVIIDGTDWLIAQILKHPDLGKCGAMFFFGFGLGHVVSVIESRKYFNQAIDLARCGNAGWREALEHSRDLALKIPDQREEEATTKPE